MSDKPQGPSPQEPERFKATERYSFGWSDYKSVTHNMTPEQATEFWEKCEAHSRAQARRETLRRFMPELVWFVFFFLCALWRYSVAT